MNLFVWNKSQIYNDFQKSCGMSTLKAEWEMVKIRCDRNHEQEKAEKCVNSIIHQQILTVVIITLNQLFQEQS